MSYTLRWTSESAKTLKQNLEYLETNGAIESSTIFWTRLKKFWKQSKANPHLYPLHRPKDNVRKCLVHKRIILFYKIVDEQHIDLLTFWNTYQDPDKLKV